MHRQFGSVCSLGILLLAAAGCGGKPPASGTSGYTIVVVGHQTEQVLEKIAAETKSKVDKSTGQVKVELGNGASVVCVPLDAEGDSRQLLTGANLVLLTIDAPDGPMPIHRKELQKARDANVPNAAVVFTKSELVDDAELLELIELETRELLNNFKFPGETAEVMFDDAAANTKRPKGMPAIVEKLRAITGK